MKHFTVTVSNELSDMISDLTFDMEYELNLEYTQLLIIEWIRQSLHLRQHIADNLKNTLDLYHTGLLINQRINTHFSVNCRSYVIMHEDGLGLSLGLYETAQHAMVNEIEEDMPF